MAKKPYLGDGNDGSFVWLAPSCDWSGGRLALATDVTYEARLVEADVLAEWIRSGAARMVVAEEK